MRTRYFQPHASFFSASEFQLWNGLLSAAETLLTLEVKVWKEGGEVKKQARVDPHKRSIVKYRPELPSQHQITGGQRHRAEFHHAGAIISSGQMSSRGQQRGTGCRLGRVETSAQTSRADFAAESV